MKTLKSSLVLLTMLMLAAPAFAASITVTGTNNPAVDVAAVQAAVDDPDVDTVILEGTFNFGYEPMGVFYDAVNFKVDQTTVDDATKALPFVKGKSTVFITRSVTVHGNPGSKIIGGRPVFWIGWDGDILHSVPTTGPDTWNGEDYGRDFIPVAWGPDMYDMNLPGFPGFHGQGIYRYYRVGSFRTGPFYFRLGWFD